LTDIEITKGDELSLEEKLRSGAKLYFSEQINTIKAVAEENGEEKQIKFHITSGYVDIKLLIKDLADVDWRWHMFEGEKSLSSRVFTVMHEGHAMIALSEKVPKTKENPNGLFEVARCKCLLESPFHSTALLKLEDIPPMGEFFWGLTSNSLKWVIFGKFRKRFLNCKVSLAFPSY
jgi:hypothetical protein